ncbi:MAG TPA: restriction endonuclease subunit S [Atribacterota bacterium]|nr:restriction endonuclease subunit S [Atribacterota bacterium]
MKNQLIKKIPEGYKQTEIGVIPEDWDVKNLGEIADVVTGNTPPTNDQSNYGEDYFFVSPADLGKSKYIFQAQKKLSNKGFRISRKLPPNSILFTCIGSTIGKAGIAPFELTSNQQINSILPNKNFSSNFLFYSLNLISPKIQSLAGEQAVPIVNKCDFEKTTIALPSNIFEQTAIATVLSDTDALIEHLEKLIAKKKAIKQGTMQQLLTGKKRLPGFSGEWEEKKLKDIADFLKGRGLSKSKIVNDGKYPCILYGELFTTYSQVIKKVKSKTNSREGLLSVKGDILMPGSTTTVGIDLATASALQQNDVLLGGDVIVIRKKEPNIYNSEFLANYLTHISKYKIAEIAQGITIIHLHGSRLQEIFVKISSDIKEQTAIATILSDMDSEIESLGQKRDKYIMLKQGMMQQLLTGRIRIYANN